MSLKVFLFVLVSITIRYDVLAQSEISTDDFTLLVPNNWKSISRSYLADLEKKNARSFERNGAQPPRTYIIGYAENDTLANDPPFFIGLFNEMKFYSGVSFDSIVAINCRAWEKIGVETEPIKDTLKSRFYLEFELGNKYVFAGYIPGAHGLLQLSFYADPNNRHERKMQFLDVYNSVNFNLPYFEDHSAERAKKGIRESGYFMAIAFAFFAFVVVARYFMKKSSQVEGGEK